MRAARARRGSWYKGVVGAIQRTDVSTVAEDGWVLRGERLLGDSPRAVAVLGHAMMVDRRTMDRPRGEGLASVLARAGVAVLSFDLRGHGQSGPTVDDGARYDYDDFVRLDVPALVRAGRRAFPALPLTVVGHSLTGHAAMIAAGLFPGCAPDAIVGLAPNLWAPRFEPSLRARVAKTALLGGLAALSAPLGRFESRAFMMGSTAEPWAYLREFVRFWIADELTSEDGCDDYLVALSRADLPVLAISSEGDRILARPPAVARFVGTMWRARVTHRVLTAADPATPDHMGLVTDSRCRFLWEEIAGFVLGHAPA